MSKYLASIQLQTAMKSLDLLDVCSLIRYFAIHINNSTYKYNAFVINRNIPYINELEQGPNLILNFLDFADL